PVAGSYVNRYATTDSEQPHEISTPFGRRRLRIAKSQSVASSKDRSDAAKSPLKSDQDRSQSRRAIGKVDGHPGQGTPLVFEAGPVCGQLPDGEMVKGGEQSTSSFL